VEVVVVFETAAVDSDDAIVSVTACAAAAADTCEGRAFLLVASSIGADILGTSFFLVFLLMSTSLLLSLIL
jgi:hypothetical protein